MWLKAHNCYYKDIVIEEEILHSLPGNGSIADLFPQKINDEISTEEENSKDGIGRSFVPLPASTRREDTAINETLNRMQTNNAPILWPEIDGFPINEFQTPGYIAKAFPTLYHCFTHMEMETSDLNDLGT